MFNWIFTPIKSVLCIGLGGMTRLFEPFRMPKVVPCVLKNDLDKMANEVEERMFKDFTIDDDFVVMEFRGDKADGTNHYVSDWCLFNGIFLGMLAHKYKITPNENNRKLLEKYAKQYTDHWIDGEGYVRRGWSFKVSGRYLEPDKTYKYDISLDQISGLVYGLSQLPPDIRKECCGSKIIKMAERLIEDNFEFKVPYGKKRYDTKVNMRFISLGVHAAIGMSVMLLADGVAHWTQKYKKQYKKYVRNSGLLLCARPITKVFEFIHGYNTNMTILALSALHTLKPTSYTKAGIKFIYKLNRKIANPFWNFLYMYMTDSLDDYELSRYMLSTFDVEHNGRDYQVKELEDMNFSDQDKIKIVQYLGDGYYNLPPKLKYKRGDAFILQSCWRKTKYYGKKEYLLRSNRQYSLLAYLATYYLYENVRIKREVDVEMQSMTGLGKEK